MQEAVIEEPLLESLFSYIPTDVGSIEIKAIDPTLAFCFFCESDESFNSLIKSVSENMTLQLFFSVKNEKPNYLKRTESCSADGLDTSANNVQFVTIDEDSDFVLL